MNVGKLGSFIREQRERSSLSLRKMSGLAGVSIPYLSQIERGLRKPSADILQAIAKGLRISSETLYVQAGMLEERPLPDVTTAVMFDATITERQKQALLQIYEAFRDEAGRVPAPEPARASKNGSASAPRKRSQSSPATRARTSVRRTDRTGGTDRAGVTRVTPVAAGSSRGRTKPSKPRKEV